MRALATVSAERLPELPDLPTFAEQGVQGMAIDSWFGFMAPARMPLGGTPEQMGAHVRAEVARWAEVVQRQSIRAE